MAIKFTRWGANCDTEEEAAGLYRERGGFYYKQSDMNRAVIWTLGVLLPLALGIILWLMLHDPGFGK